METPIKNDQPIIFHIPSPFPYQNSKFVPWKYNATVSVGGEEIQVLSVKIFNIASPRGITRSGCLFAPKYIPKVVRATIPAPQAGASVCVPTIPARVSDVSISKSTYGNVAERTTLKGKEVVNEKEHAEKIIYVEEGVEFLKLIKQSDLKIVDQLGKLHR